MKDTLLLILFPTIVLGIVAMVHARRRQQERTMRRRERFEEKQQELLASLRRKKEQEERDTENDMMRDAIDEFAQCFFFFRWWR